MDSTLGSSRSSLEDSTLSIGSLSLSGNLPPPSTSAAYSSAVELYLNKRFAESKAIVEQLLQKSSDQLADQSISRTVWIRIWILYFGLVDAAQKHDDSGLDPDIPTSGSGINTAWSSQDQIKMITEILTGDIWSKVEQSSIKARLHFIPPELALSLASLMIRHPTDMKLLNAKLEEYLATIAGLEVQLDSVSLSYYLKLLDIYVLGVLPAQNEYDFAREFVSVNTFYGAGHKKKVLAKLDNLQESERINSRRKEAEAESERQRENLKKKEIEKEKERERLEQRAALERQQNIINESNNGEGQVSPSLPTSSTPEKKITKRTGALSGIFSGLLSTWKENILATAKSAALIRFLVIICILTLGVSNPLIRERVRRIIRRVWNKVAQTFKMGLKVSYV